MPRSNATALTKRLDALEGRRTDTVVRQISDLMDELSAKAAGGRIDHGDSELMQILDGGDDDAA